MKTGIYIIKNNINDKLYIGSSTNITNRLSFHKRKLKANKHFSDHLQRAFNKYGESNFTFAELLICKKEDLLINEIYYIKLFKANTSDKGYNKSLPSTTISSHIFTSDTKLKMSETAKKRYNNYNKFELVNSEGVKLIFNNLVEASIYLKDNKYSKANLNCIRGRLSDALRGVLYINGIKVGSPKNNKIYKHTFKIIN